MSDGFDKAFGIVMELEGGFVLHRNPTESTHTYAGIYRKAHPDWEGWEVIDRGETPSLVSVRKFYYKNFYRKWEKLPPVVTFILFDAAVNMGESRAVKLAQKAVGVKADGVTGPVTMGAISAINPYIFAGLFTVEKKKFYHSLATRKAYAPYLTGWLARATRVEKEADRWTA